MASSEVDHTDFTVSGILQLRSKQHSESQRGDANIIVRVRIPAVVTNKERELIQRLAVVHPNTTDIPIPYMKCIKHAIFFGINND